MYSIIMAGQLHLLLYFFYQAKLFSDSLDILPCLIYYFDHVTCHVIILLKFGKSANWWQNSILVINTLAFSMQS